MKQPVKSVVPAAKTLRFGPYFLRQSVLLSLLFIALNGVMLLRGGTGVQTMDVVRLVVASVVGGAVGAAVMWLLARKRR